MKSIWNLRFCSGYGEIINFGEFETTIKFEGRFYHPFERKSIMSHFGLLLPFQVFHLQATLLYQVEWRGIIGDNGKFNQSHWLLTSWLAHDTSENISQSPLLLLD